MNATYFYKKNLVPTPKNLCGSKYKEKKMFLESRVVVSLISIIILFLSFIASFKHQNATIFFVGLIVSLLINKCETVVPTMKKFFATSDTTTETSGSDKNSQSVPVIPQSKPLEPMKPMDVPNPPPVSLKKSNESIVTVPVPKAKVMEATNTKKTTTTKQDTKIPDGLTFHKPEVRHMNADASKPIPPEVAQRLVTNSIQYAANRNQQRAVYSFGRPLIHEVAQGKASALSATPDFVTFGNVLVGNLRTKNEPTPDVYLKTKPEQNPELLKLTSNPNLIPSSDYFPNCKSGGLGGNETIDADPRDKLRCRFPGIY